MYRFDKIRNLIDQGLNNSEIARHLGIHRGTVRKYRSSNTPPSYQTRSGRTREDPLANFTEKILEWVNGSDQLSATSIYLFIKELGYEGSLRTVERRVEAIRSGKPKERFFEQEYVAGEQSQFDFKESVMLPFYTGEQLAHLLIGTLPHSGAFFIKAFPNKTYEAYVDGMHSFFEYIGGMTQKIRFDNLSPVVKKVLKGRDRIYTDAFEKAVAYYGFGLLPCAPAKGSDKGDVERDIKTFFHRLKDSIYLEKKTFKGFGDFNVWLAEFCEKHLIPKAKELLIEEKAHLKPLPPRDENILGQVIVTTVSKHGTVRFNKSTFSVPDHMIGRSIKVVVSAYDVKFYQLSPRLELVATHPRIAPNTSSILLEHAISSLVRKPQAMVRWAHRQILFPHPILQQYYEYLKHLNAYNAEAEFLRSVNLIHYAPLSEIIAGVEVILSIKSPNPFFDLKSLLTVTGPSPTETGEQACRQPPLNCELSHYDSLIPA